MVKITNQIEKVIILGTGPAGLTAALYLSRANMKPLVVEGFEPGGQLTYTAEIENFPGFSDGLPATTLIENMRTQATKFGARFRRGQVTAVDLSNPDLPFKLRLDGGDIIETEALILATGASACWLGIPGEEEYKGQGISTCATCDGFFYRDKRVIVVGGGDSAMEEAIFLTKFATEVTIVHRRDKLRASHIMQERARANKKIKWALDRTPVRVYKEDGLLQLVVQNNEKGQEEVLNADGIFLAIGHTPNTSFVDRKILDDAGYIETVPGSTKTVFPGLFACGDVQDRIYRQAITAAGTGCMAALDCERYLEELEALKQDWKRRERMGINDF